MSHLSRVDSAAGYSFKENARLDKVLPDLNQQCLHYFETLDLSEAEMILDRVHALFKTSSFYYDQLKQCYLDLINANLNKKSSQTVNINGIE